MIGLTQQLAIELAPHGIRVNCVCPGSTDTDMMDGTFGRTAARFDIDREAARKGAISRIPMGRQGQVDEQAAAVAFLASDDARYITGPDAERRRRPPHGLTVSWADRASHRADRPHGLRRGHVRCDGRHAKSVSEGLVNIDGGEILPAGGTRGGRTWLRDVGDRRQ